MKRMLTLAVAMAAYGTVSATDLVEVYGVAKLNDPALRAARANREATLEAEPIARSQLLPNVLLAGDASYDYTDVRRSVAGSFNDDFPRAAASIQLSQPIYRKELSVGLEQAEFQVTQADTDFEGAEQDLIIRVADAYFGVLSARDTLGFVRANKRAIARQLDQAKQRFEVGLIAITDVHEAQSRFDQARADEIAAENDLDNQREELLEIVGDPSSYLAYPPTPLEGVREDVVLTPPMPASLDEWTTLALANNPDVISAKLDAEIARKEIERQDAGDSVALDLVGSYGLARTDADRGSDANDATIGIQLSLPLYTGGGVDAATRQARHRFQAAQDQLEARRRSVQTQVRNAYRGVVASISRAEALDATRVSARSALEATEAGFEVGTRTLVDVLDEQRDLFRAQADYLQSRYDYILNMLALLQAAGTLADDSLNKYNDWLVPVSLEKSDEG